MAGAAILLWYGHGLLAVVPFSDHFLKDGFHFHQLIFPSIKSPPFGFLLAEFHNLIYFSFVKKHSERLLNQIILMY
jgi:hypothetical protein